MFMFHISKVASTSFSSLFPKLVKTFHSVPKETIYIATGEYYYNRHAALRIMLLCVPLWACENVIIQRA